jgi:hypothetical protein
MSRKIEFSLLLSVVTALVGISPALAAPRTDNFRVDRQYKGPICIELRYLTKGDFSVQWGSYNRSGSTGSIIPTGGTYVQLQARGNNIPNIVFQSPNGASFSQGACKSALYRVINSW